MQEGVSVGPGQGKVHVYRGQGGREGGARQEGRGKQEEQRGG